MDETSSAGSRCANCGMSVADAYCPRCGQERHEPPAVHELLHESISHFLSLEGRGWQSLLKLLFAPGVITVEYVAGRQVRYVRPSRLYLWICVLAIALVASLDLQLGLRLTDGTGLVLNIAVFLACGMLLRWGLLEY